MTDMKKGSPTGFYDSEFSKICMGDIVEMFGTTYKVVYAYGALRNMYHARKNHKLKECHIFCKWVDGLPCSELITEA